jgi:hypothetical protein
MKAHAKFHVVSILVLFLFCFSGLTDTAFAQNAEKPEIVKDMPKGLPLKTEILAPVKAEDYPEKIRIKVTNTGNQPIYSLRLRLVIETGEILSGPDGKRAWKTEPLTFGRYELNTGIGEEPNADDPYIRPSGYYVFSLSKPSQDAYKNSKERGGFLQPLFYRLEFSDLSYGDGSGFTRGGVPFSKKN